MENPKVEKKYTTIFRDGSVIHENPWLMFPDGHGKWYWDEEVRGGVVAWTEIPEGGYKYHSYYKLPDWELEDLIINANKYLSILTFKGEDTKCLNAYLIKQGFASYEQMAKQDMQDYYKGYKVNERTKN